jgi:hypothetical protein
VVTADSTGIGHADIAGEVLKGVVKRRELHDHLGDLTRPTASTKAIHPTNLQLKALLTEHAIALPRPAGSTGAGLST